MTVLLKRLIEVVPTLLGVTFLTFMLLRFTPGDPVRLMMGPEATPEAIEMMRAQLGYDKHPLVHYFYYLGDLLRGDMGMSITHAERSVMDLIGSRLGATIELAVVAMFFATITAMFVGVISAVRPRSAFDNISRVGVFIFLAMPSFWLGLELIIIMARNFELFPPAGRGSGSLYSHISHLVLPGITLGVGTGAFLSRILRSSMLEVLHADYVRTAWAKGLDEPRVVLKHALRNALIPFVTVAGLSAGALLGGSVIVETVFAWPGIGELMVSAIKERDLPVAMGCVLTLATIFIFINLAVDLTYAVLDPRIRVGAKEGTSE